MPSRPRSSDGAGAREPVSGEELCAAAVELATSAAPSLRRTARRFSLCVDDADDAYQRSLEILLTKAPTARREELRPWLHTVIKHEALALRRQRERSVSGEDDASAADAVADPDRAPDEAATGRERVRRTAEALAALKPSELQCLMLKALGYSYDEISERTGFSWTKVNRSLTEGRRRFFERFGEIASGTACRRYQPLLSVACDGHARAEDERLLHAHLASCAGCRAALRAYRSAPARLAELLPPAMVLPLLDRTSAWARLHDWLAVTAGERATAIGLKLQQGAEVASAQKAAAVVASTAALAGGGMAVQPPGHPDRERGVRAEATDGHSGRVTPADPEPQRPSSVPAVESTPASADTVAPAPSAATGDERRRPGEFGFEGGATAGAPEPPPPAADAPVAAAATGTTAPRAEFAPGGGSSAAGAGGGEFAP